MKAGVKYAIASSSFADGQPAVYRINADGTVGAQLFMDTPYTDVHPMAGTEINGLVNGEHYILFELHGTVEEADVYFPTAPYLSLFYVFRISPLDSLFRYLQNAVGVGYDTLGIFDIYSYYPIADEGLDICFYLGSQYAGRTVRIDHYHNGALEGYSALVNEAGVG